MCEKCMYECMYDLCNLRCQTFIKIERVCNRNVFRIGAQNKINRVSFYWKATIKEV